MVIEIDQKAASEHVFVNPSTVAYVVAFGSGKSKDINRARPE